MELVYYQLNLEERLNKKYIFNLSPNVEINIDVVSNTISKINIETKNNINIFNDYNNRVLNLNVFIGKNGAGKTTLLNGIEDIIYLLSGIDVKNKNENEINDEIKAMFSFKYIIIFMEENELFIYTDYETKGIHEYDIKYGMETIHLHLNEIDKLTHVLVVSYSNILDYSKYDVTQYRDGNNCLTISDLALMAKEWRDYKENTNEDKYLTCPLTVFYHEETVRQIRYYADNKDRIPFKINGILAKNKVRTDGNKEIRRKIIEIVNYNFSDEQNNHNKTKFILTLIINVIMEGYALRANVVSVRRKIQKDRDSFFNKIDPKPNKFINCMQLVDYLLNQMYSNNKMNSRPAFGEKSDFIELAHFMYMQIDDSQFIQDGNAMYLRKKDFDASSSHISNVDYMMQCYDKITNHQISYLDFEWKMSNGEQKLLSMFSRFYSLKDKINEETKKTLLFLLDEPDTSLHPAWQQEFVLQLMKYIPALYSSKVQFIITTHSPIFLSDIPKEHVCYIDDEIKHEETFSANIFNLYKKAFILKPRNIGVIGDFSNEIIKNISYALDFWILYLEASSLDTPATTDKAYEKILMEEINMKKKKLKYILCNREPGNINAENWILPKEIKHFIDDGEKYGKGKKTPIRKNSVEENRECLAHYENITKLIGEPILKKALIQKIQTIREYMDISDTLMK